MAETFARQPPSSICLLACHFGKLPPYLGCFLRSCAANPDINWIIFTDDETPQQLPANVTLKLIPWSDLLAMFSSRLDFPVSFSDPYLLCVFRPAFGLIFEDDLKGYDFWGHCDLDMIFGRLRKFLSENILASHDKILCRGHLTLYRNNSSTNQYFKLNCPGIKDFRKRFPHPQRSDLQFDEWKGINLILRYHDIPQFHDEFIIDIVPPTRWKITRFAGTAIHNYPEQVFYWYKGRVFHAHYNCDHGLADDEYAYIHFQRRMMPAPAFDPFAQNGFFITPDGFFPYDRGPLTAEDFARYNQGRWRPGREILRTVIRGVGKRLRLISREN